MKLIPTLLLLSVVLATAHSRAAEPAPLPNPFFAYCVGLGVEKDLAALPAQLELAPMLAEQGYAGMAFVGTGGVVEMAEALQKKGLKLFATNITVNVDPDNPGFDPKTLELLPKLAPHGTLLWPTIVSKKYKPSSTEGDDRAVALLRQLGDAAAKHGLSVSLYPHRACYAERVEDVIRLAKKIDRPNVGISFTFCHFLATDDAKNLDRMLTAARPYLTMVTINGTDGYDPKNRAGWIRTLDEGSLDVSQVLTTLRRLDYRGPIGFIAYGIKGDRRDILAREMKGWKALGAKAAAAK